MSRMLIRLAVAAVIVIAAVWLLSARAPQRDDLGLGPVLPGLSERINAVEQVSIRASGGASATLVRQAAGWGVHERHDWPADTGKLRDYLLRLGVAQRVEAKTQRVESYPRLGVQDIDTADANGARIDIQGGGEPLALIIGQNNPQGHGSYVRVPGQAQSWLADLDIGPERKPQEWLQRDLIDVDPRRIVRIQVHPVGATAFTLSRPAVNQARWQLAPLPAKRDTAQARADAIAGFLQGLRLDDVAPAAEAESGDAEQVQFDTADGLQVTLRLWQRDTIYWAGFGLQFDEAAATAFARDEVAREQQADTAAANKDETDADAAPDAAAKPAPEIASVAERVTRWRLQADVAAARFNGWVFAIAPYKADNLRGAQADYVSEAK